MAEDSPVVPDPPQAPVGVIVEVRKVMVNNELVALPDEEQTPQPWKRAAEVVAPE